MFFFQFTGCEFYMRIEFYRQDNSPSSLLLFLNATTIPIHTVSYSDEILLIKYGIHVAKH